MMQMLKKLLLVARPISWPNTAYPFAAGYLVSGGQLDVTFWVATLYFAGPYNLLMYGINDVFDYESDILNPRKGGVEGMREQRAFHPIITRTAIIANAPFLFYLLAVGSIWSNMVLTLAVIGVLVYSLPPFRFKERPVLDSVTSSFHFVGPLVFALVLTASLSDAWLYVVAFFAWGMASHMFGAIQDIVPDRAAKIHSIATYFGARATVWLAILLYAIAGLVLIYAGLPAAIVGIAGLIYVLNCLPYITITDAQSATVNAGWRRFLWMNYFTGFIITMVLIFAMM